MSDDGLLYLDDLRVGQRFVTGEYPLDAEGAIAFASQWDPQPFHTDPAAAQDSSVPADNSYSHESHGASAAPADAGGYSSFDSGSSSYDSSSSSSYDSGSSSSDSGSSGSSSD